MSALRPALILALAASLAAPAVAAADELTPRPQRVFQEKPRIEDYADYNAFLVDIMEFRRQQREGTAAADAPAGVAMPAEPVEDHSLYVILGPETIDEAVERARHLPHPVYRERKRYNRTTSQSFPLQQMDHPDMSGHLVGGRLADVNEGNLDEATDESAEQYALKLTGDNPDNDDESRYNAAVEDSYTLGRAEYDPKPTVIFLYDYKPDGEQYVRGIAKVQEITVHDPHE